VLSLAPLTLEITCSKGTYIRALARDLAVALGTVGHLAHLVRTRVGPFTLETAVVLETLDVAVSLLPPDAALPDAPAFHASDDDVARFMNGQPIAVAGLRGDPVRVYDAHGGLVGLARADGDQLMPRLML
jgi:tRNA pseudouridine55 synthase